MTNPTKTLLLLLLVSMVSFSLSASSFDETVIKLNPDYKLKRMSNGTVIMSAIRNGETVQHEFTDIYADLLLAAYRKQRMGYIMESLSKKYYYSDEECRREIKHALNVLSEWDIVLREDKLASIN
jgi:mRNA degradation ribonuclease J1/J2